MEYFVTILCIIVLFVIGVLLNLNKYDDHGFDKKGFHKNGTRFDHYGYDNEGYNRLGYDKDGYNRQGYNIIGRNNNGKYNRYYDRKIFESEDYSFEGFLSPEIYPIELTDHARERMVERLGISDYKEMDDLVFEAYCFGKSTNQMSKNEVNRYIKRENRHENTVIIVYKNIVFIFSSTNTLITLYRDDKYYT